MTRLSPFEHSALSAARAPIGRDCAQRAAEGALWVLVWALFCLPCAHAMGPHEAAAAGSSDIRLAVDMRRAPQRLVEVRETLEVQPGPLTLYYPEWIPGEHGPNGPIANVAGLTIRAGGKPLRWRRDLRDMFALHVTVPEGAKKLELAFQFLPPKRHGRFSAGPSTGTDLAVLEFNQVVFYPARSPTHAISVQATVRLPEGWQHATALQQAGSGSEGVRFETVSLDRLIDSPLIGGKHFNRVDLGTQDDAAVSLHVAGAHGAETRPDEGQADALRKLGQQALALFGGVPYRHYKILLLLSDRIGHFGLEHRESSDDRLPADFFSDPTLFRVLAPLLVHEWIHAWNGKFRYPADLKARDFNTPVQTDLLWVYEGLTDYWTSVLSARAGLWTPAYFRAALADTREQMAYRSGRAWRSLQDTADAAQLAWEGSRGWYNWRRSADFYPEGQLLWLDVDTRIRQLSHNRRSLDDFARAFFGQGINIGDSKSYSFEQLVAALNAIQPHDWATFLRQRLDYTGVTLPYRGLQQAGWKLVYRDQPGAREQDIRQLDHGLKLTASLGLSVSGKGVIRDVQWQGPAFRAGLIPGMSLVAVNGRDFSPDVLTDAVANAAHSDQPIELLVRNEDLFRTLKVAYHGGLRYPQLERIPGTPDRLADIIRAQ